MNNKTKIIATVGPGCDNKKTLQSMVDAGVNVFRLNMSHGDEGAKRKLYQLVKSLKYNNTRPTILTDLAGPKIRITKIDKGFSLNEKENVIISNEKTLKEKHIKVSNEFELSHISKGTKILIDDGRVQLKVLDNPSANILRCTTLIGGEVQARKGVNFPGVTLDTPSLTDQDIVDLKMALDQGADWIALSFVRRANDVLSVHKIMDDVGKRIPVMAKIEKWEALDNLEEIADTFDGLMVARGDLGVEIDVARVPLAQKKVIEIAGALGKPVVIATQLLESMINNKTPTRAEVSDIANAIFDSVDALLVTGETAIGKYPIDVIKILAQVISETEEATTFQRESIPEDVNKTPEAISHAVCEISNDLDINLLMSMTHTGSTARMISRYRPQAKIFALTPFENIARQLELIWGITPIKVDSYNNIEAIPDLCNKVLHKLKLINKGDKFIITGGVPMGIEGTTNYLSVQTHR